MNDQLKDMIDEYKIFNDSMGDITNVEHNIELVSQPEIKIQNYSIPLKYRERAREHTQKLLDNDIIFRTQSDIISAAFFVSKKNTEDLRMLVDYRALNAVTKIIPFPFPKIHDYLIQLSGATIFSQIDMKNGYYQIRMAPEDMKKTAFSLDNQVYAFKRMPYGLVNAPRTFQMTMMDILGDLEYVKVYLDDVLIYSDTHENHILHIQEVLKRFKTTKLESILKNRYF